MKLVVFVNSAISRSLVASAAVSHSIPSSERSSEEVGLGWRAVILRSRYGCEECVALLLVDKYEQGLDKVFGMTSAALCTATFS